MTYDAVAGCKNWLDNKRRYGLQDFTPTQMAMFRQVEAVGAEAAQLLDRRNRMMAEIERADAQLEKAEQQIVSLRDAFEREEAAAA